MACIFRKMPYVFLSINKLHFSYTRKDLFSGKLPYKNHAYLDM